MTVLSEPSANVNWVVRTASAPRVPSDVIPAFGPRMVRGLVKVTLDVAYVPAAAWMVSPDADDVTAFAMDAHGVVCEPSPVESLPVGAI